MSWSALFKKRKLMQSQIPTFDWCNGAVINTWLRNAWPALASESCHWLSLCVLLAAQGGFVDVTFLKAKTTTLKHSHGKHNHIAPYDNALTQCTLEIQSEEKAFGNVFIKMLFIFYTKGHMRFEWKEPHTRGFPDQLNKCSANTLPQHPLLLSSIPSMSVISRP